MFHRVWEYFVYIIWQACISFFVWLFNFLFQFLSMRIIRGRGRVNVAYSKWCPPVMAVARRLTGFCCVRPVLTLRQLSISPARTVEVAAILPWRRRAPREREEEGGGVATADEAPRREKFIPVTRRSLMKRLREEEGLLNWEEREKLEVFAAALDTRFSQRFLGTLAEAKVYTHSIPRT